MKEYLTEALVLNVRPAKEQDRSVDFYTKDLGRVRARVIGGRKIVSKLSPHLDVLNLVKVRLINKNRLTVTDVLSYDRFADLRKNVGIYSHALELLFLLRSLVPEGEPDLRLWHYLVSALKHQRLSRRDLFNVLGYNPLFSNCSNCNLKRVDYFTFSEQSFLCSPCRDKFYFNRSDLIYIF